MSAATTSALTLAAAKPDSQFVQVGPRENNLHRRLSLAGGSDASILILGDSTGVGTQWPFFLAQSIAAAYPAYTVILAPWDDTVHTFPAAQRATIQAGSNGHTITLWNFSVSGQVVGYSQTWTGTIRSQAVASTLPFDVILWNYGHNSPETGANYRAIQEDAVAQFQLTYPQAAMVQIAQNPRSNALWGASAANDVDKATQVAALANAEGHTLVDAHTNFLAYGPYEADLLLTDGLHPNPVGAKRIADLVWDAIGPRKRSMGTGHQAKFDRLWIPATDFFAVAGTPALAMHGALPAWELDPNTTESVVTSVYYPSEWAAVNVIALFSTAGGSTNPALVKLQYQYTGADVVGSLSGASLADAFTDQTDVTVTPSTTAFAGAAVRTQNRIMWSQRPVALRLVRDAPAGGDTLASDLWFYGLEIIKES